MGGEEEWYLRALISCLENWLYRAELK